MRDAFLHKLALLIWKRPIAILLIGSILAAVSAGYAWRTLELNANTDDLIAPSRPFMQTYRAFLEEFGDLEYIYAVVENPGDPMQAREVVDALTAELQKVPGLPGVHSAIDPQEQLRIATRAMPEEELADLVQVAEALPILRSGSTARVLSEANSRLRQLVQSGAQMPPQEQERVGATAVFLLKALAAAEAGSSSQSEMAFLLGEDQRREYFVSDTGRFYFITIVPVKDYGTLSVIESPLRRIREAIAAVQRRFPAVNIGLTGKPVLQADEMATTNRDMTRASMIAVALCGGLFMVAFGGVVKPLLAVLAFACGAAWTYGFSAIAIGQLNLLSVVFILVLIGVGMDYGVHMLSRYREARQERDVRGSILSAVVAATRGNATGALCSSSVFLMAIFTTFQGLRELGIIAGTGLLLCMAAMTLVLPALTILVDRRRADLSAATPSQSTSMAGAAPGQGRRSALNWMIDHPIPVLLIAAAISIALLIAPGTFRFERNLLELQAQGLESVEWEHRILEDSAAASWFGASIAPTQEEALEIINRARQRPTIGAIRSVFDVQGSTGLIPPQTAQRESLRQQLERASSTASATPESAPGEWSAGQLSQAVQALNTMALGAALQAPAEAQQLRQLAADLRSLVEQLQGHGQAARERIEQAVQGIGGSIDHILRGNALPMREALPDALRDQLVSPRGRYLVMLHPSQNVWEYEPMRRFIDDLREVDPNVTGAPITHFESLHEMQNAFLQMAGLALGVIIILTLIDFRHVGYVLLALLPTAVALLWTIELMGLLDASFNLANFFSVPILIGLSVDGSVHILHRYREGGVTRFSLGATRRAVIVTATTTMIGFGCLMLAHHRGLFSLGQVMAMGAAASMIASIILLPATLAVIERLFRRG